MKIHIQTVHEGVKEHKCDHCGKTFGVRHNLKKHIESSHEGPSIAFVNTENPDFKKSKNNRKRSEQCEFCTKSFSRSHDLKRHIKSVHEGIRNYKCEFCDKSFSHAQSLDRHRFSVHYIRINADFFEKENKIPFVEPF